MEKRTCLNCRYWNDECAIVEDVSDCSRINCLPDLDKGPLAFRVDVGVFDDSGLEARLMTGKNFSCPHHKFNKEF